MARMTSMEALDAKIELAQAQVSKTKETAGLRRKILKDIIAIIRPVRHSKTAEGQKISGGMYTNTSAREMAHKSGK